MRTDAGLLIRLHQQTGIFVSVFEFWKGYPSEKIPAVQDTVRAIAANCYDEYICGGIDTENFFVELPAGFETMEEFLLWSLQQRH